MNLVHQEVLAFQENQVYLVNPEKKVHQVRPVQLEILDHQDRQDYQAFLEKEVTMDYL